MQCFRPPSIYLCSIIQNINSDDELQSIENQIAQLKSKHPTIKAQPTAYVFRSAEDTLTFCYDAACESRNGDTWHIPQTLEDTAPWAMDEIKKIVIAPSFADHRPTSTARWFENLEYLTTIEGLEHLNTSCVTDMNSMFWYSNVLTTLDVSHFDTSQVEDMSYMFCGCASLTTLDVSNFCVYKITYKSGMFEGCDVLQGVDFSKFEE